MGMLTHQTVEDTLNDVGIEAQRLKMDYDAAKENLGPKFEIRPAEAVHEMKMLSVRAGKIAALAQSLQQAINSAVTGAQHKLNADQLAAAAQIPGLHG